MENKQPVVIVIGGGFGGIELIKQFKHQPVKVILVDKNNYHTFQPLLYQVASGGLDSSSIASPYRKIFDSHKNFSFRMAEVIRIDAAKNTVVTSIGELNYDFLVIATGSKTNFFGMSSVEKWSMPLKSIPDALNLRSDILQEFEKASIEEDVEKQKMHLNFVIVGAGPTGVETAGALAEFKQTVLPKDYPELNRDLMKVHLIEAGPRVLPSMSEQSSGKALKFLHKLGVNVLLNTSVKDYDGTNILLNSGETLKSSTLVWSAGVKGATIEGLAAAAMVGNRFKVDAFNKVDGYQNIYAIGDVAAMITPETPKGHPMVAPVSIQQASNLVKNMIRERKGKTKTPFKYFDKGSMATVGRNKAVVDIGFFKFQGFFAWMVWMFLHLMLLVSFRNRVVTFVNWMWNYLSYQRAIRLIVRPFKVVD